MGDCAAEKDSWVQCLNTSYRNPGKCALSERELRKCAKTAKANFCIQETVDLMYCARSPGSDVCANEFVKMRECNRPLGPELVEKGDALAVDSSKAALYAAPKDGISGPPSRSFESRKSAATSMAAQLNLAEINKELKIQAPAH
uniref:IMS import disulfide relay-system CHCH-CHCH-like Cx9C domain-containing protein n=1 Tax=Chromera velia CCMP2878 TaxID=1169474 RepID=A0A0G4GBI0_9ALVE|mmetsp:Transcript_30999/g.61136  ORF Transcript_30999/g.61136 Transcript_30999/m.61136 type:complete len:144 (-) Transcript_30999:494-925(-)|eukprot:Cvel_21091.t1-p1 / transcript=Cvel_21091.t1 / gene=Cvel_21091 / organism=Chromera_velia_CCMP2878 / gene_product=hypothetical protein / transcript_product=hypothetical protein / location=Cvel_scaffold1950:7914-8342(+) / protein_length=143 / sequence_SO=supercontig / SO=protein_coding / is_pseudo=false